MLPVSLSLSLKSVLQRQLFLISKQEDTTEGEINYNNYTIKYDINFQLNYINIHKWLQNAIQNKYFATTDGIVC